MERCSSWHTVARGEERRDGVPALWPSWRFVAMSLAIRGVTESSGKRHGIDIPPSTSRFWLRQREIHGSKAQRRTRKQSNCLGRKQRVSASDLDCLIDQNDRIHLKPYDDQIEDLSLNNNKRTLQQNTSDRRNARRYRKRPIPPISENNLNLRQQYGKHHENKSLIDSGNLCILLMKYTSNLRILPVKHSTNYDKKGNRSSNSYNLHHQRYSISQSIDIGI